MGKISYLNILFDKKDPIYYSGEILSGIIQIGITERLKINSLFVNISGETNLHWYILI